MWTVYIIQYYVIRCLQNSNITFTFTGINRKVFIVSSILNSNHVLFFPNLSRLFFSKCLALLRVPKCFVFIYLCDENQSSVKFRAKSAYFLTIKHGVEWQKSVHSCATIENLAYEHAVSVRVLCE